MTRILILPGLMLLMSFAFSPMSQTIELGEGVKQVQYLVDNSTNEPMAVEISLRERIQKEDGTEETPATKALAAFPPQLIVPPKEKRSVRVTFIGAKPTQEQAYRVIAEQLPLDVDGKKRKGSGIKMLLKYVAALYVNPGETSAKLVVKVLESTPQLKLLVENAGTMHAPLTRPTLTLTAKEKKVVLKGEQLKGLAGENVLAGSKRVFTIPRDKDVDPSFSGTLKLE